MMQLFDNVCTPIDTDVKMAIDPLDKPIDTPILSISTEIGENKSEKCGEGEGIKSEMSPPPHSFRTDI
jgi:hypothetical protein